MECWKKVIVMSISAFTLLNAQPLDIDAYKNALYNYLQSHQLKINGKFYKYDFEHDGKIDANDWLYVASNEESYRLMGNTPSSKDPFGWQKVTINPQGAPDGYFIYLKDFSLDKEEQGTDAFSWVYVSNNKVYKLMGATQDHQFRYLDLNGDGSADPLDITYTIEEDVITFSSKSQNTKELLFYGLTNHRVLAGLKSVTLFDPKNPSQAIYTNADTTDVRRPEVTTKMDNFNPATLKYEGLHRKYVHFVSGGYAYRADLQTGVVVKQAPFALDTSRQLRYTKISYLGTNVFLIAKDANKTHQYLIAPWSDKEHLPAIFDGKRLVDVTYPSYGAAIDGYMVTAGKSLQKCDIELKQCQEILTFTKSASLLGNILSTTKAVFNVDNQAVIVDKAKGNVEDLQLQLPSRIGHTTPYAYNDNHIYFLQDGKLYDFDLAMRKQNILSDGIESGSFRAFTDKMVIVADDDNMYAVAKDGSTPQALHLSQIAKTKGHKYDFSIATKDHYLYNLFWVEPETGRIHFRACVLDDAMHNSCKEDSFWASTIVANPNGVLTSSSNYPYTALKFIRIDNADNYGGGDVKAIDQASPLGDGILLGKVADYNFQTFINSGYKNENIPSGGYIVLNAKNDANYKGESFLVNINEANSLQNITHEPEPLDSEINRGRSHCHGRYCSICHSFAGGKIYADWNTSAHKPVDLTPTTVGKYTIRFMFDNGQTLRAVIKKGMGENFNTKLQNLAGKNFTAQVVDLNGTVHNSSGEYTHQGAAYFNCNYCHSRHGGRNGAPGPITIKPIGE
ncbi:hypothetical protein NitYY0826_C0380 [Nitratiruptor sp. YY08-26]|uniref:hypothetical protein n=1 Tax=unclassified Nitratiruptor TaxID=2624044 RepID=UPI001916B9F6|nr:MULTISPECIES: hypothetical protein [unclassified Nitratiruptor]BCD61525.1 hypothetical protein NitYY0813_C0379 [Nitratiruptor sp. YY08-13]BCD65459.1 hypothetical protein NitYY0826_C0380 [Nitratiruptor sp. YY08-26]